MPVVLLLVLIFCAWLHLKISKTNLTEQQNSENFWTKERKANATRKTDISNLSYYKIPVDTMPFQETSDETLNGIQNKIRSLSEQSILNLSGISNTELKLQYGAPNLTFLSNCDQNYLLLIRTLHDWASYLYVNNDSSNALSILEYAVDIKSDMRKTYVLLADIYHQKGRENSLNELLTKAEKLDCPMKDSIVSYIKDKLSAERPSSDPLNTEQLLK